MNNIPPYYHFAHLTASQTPILRPQETIHNLLDHVGLYQGEYKIVNRQSGRIYLTNLRLIYVDDLDPVNESVWFKLGDIASLSYYSGFLKSSPKITVLFRDDIVNQLVLGEGNDDDDYKGLNRAEEDQEDQEDQVEGDDVERNIVDNSIGNNNTDRSRRGPYGTVGNDGDFANGNSNGKNKGALPLITSRNQSAADIQNKPLITDQVSTNKNSKIINGGRGSSDNNNGYEITPWKCKICSHTNTLSSQHYDLDMMLNPNLNSAVRFPNCVNCGIAASKSSVSNAIKKSRSREEKKLEKQRKLRKLKEQKESEEKERKMKNGDLIDLDSDLPFFVNYDYGGSGDSDNRKDHKNDNTNNAYDGTSSKAGSNGGIGPCIDRNNDGSSTDLSEHVRNGSSSKINIRRQNQCPVCTFINHPLMTNCEMCGTLLQQPQSFSSNTSTQILPPNCNINNKSSNNSKNKNKSKSNYNGDNKLNNSNDLIIINVENNATKQAFKASYIKLSFRDASNNLNMLKTFLKQFQELIDDLRLNEMYKNAETNVLVQKIIMPSRNRAINELFSGNDAGSALVDRRGQIDIINGQDGQLQQVQEQRQRPNLKAGISALEKKQGNVIQKNELILESSLEDLNSLMSKAQELQNLIQSFDKILKINNRNGDSNAKYRETLNESRNMLGLNNNDNNSNGSNGINNIVLNNNFNFLNKLSNKELFYKELARNLSAFLLNYVFESPEQKKHNQMQLLTHEYSGGIITLTDLYSLYNRALGFNNNLISPSDLLNSVSLFDELKLPLKFRKFAKSGLKVIQDYRSSSDEEILNSVIELLVAEKFQLDGRSTFGDIGDFYSEADRKEDEVALAEPVSKGLNIQKLVSHFNLSVGILKEILDIGLDQGLLLIDEDISGSNYFLNEIVDYEW